MTEESKVPQEEIDRVHAQLNQEAEAGGYHLNPDVAFTKELVRGLLVNEKRYGYRACPCRLSSAVKAENMDIICPCDYRDPDLLEWDACYCGLYVSAVALRGEHKISSIPDRRPSPGQRQIAKSADQRGQQPAITSTLKYPVWRCKVCGYMCARDRPPEFCPICKAKQDRFERFM